MSDAIRRDWPYAILISSLLVLLAGLALPRLGRWAALGAGSLAVALSGVVLIVFAVAGKDSTAPHCIPFRSPTWYHLGDLAIYGVTFAALSLSAAIAAAPARKQANRLRRHARLAGPACGMSFDAGDADGPRVGVKTVTRRSRDGR